MLEEYEQMIPFDKNATDIVFTDFGNKRFPTTNDMLEGRYTDKFFDRLLTSIDEQAKDAPIQVYRLLAIYKAAVSPSCAAKRTVSFPLDAYCDFFGLARTNAEAHIWSDLDQLLTRVYRFRGRNSTMKIVLFSGAWVRVDEQGQKWVHLRCSDLAVPYFFFADPSVNAQLKMLRGNLVKSSLPRYTSPPLEDAKTKDVLRFRFLCYLEMNKYKGSTFPDTVSNIVIFLYGEDYIDEMGISTLDWSYIKRRLQSLCKYTETAKGIFVSFEPGARVGYGGRISTVNFTVEWPNGDDLTEQIIEAPYVLEEDEQQVKGSALESSFAQRDENVRTCYFTEDQMEIYRETNGRFTEFPDGWTTSELSAFQHMVCSSLFTGLSVEELRELDIAARLVPDEYLPEVCAWNDPNMAEIAGGILLIRDENRNALLDEVAAMTNTRIQQGRVKPENRFKYMRGILKKKAKGEPPKTT